PEQRYAIARAWKEEVYRGAGAHSGELNFEGSDGTRSGLESSAQHRFSRCCGDEWLEASTTGLLDFHCNDVATAGKPRRRSLKRNGRGFPELLKPSKSVAYWFG